MATIIPLQSVSRCEGRAMIQDREKKGIEKKREDQRSLLSELYEAFNRDNRFERRNKTRMRQMRSEVIFQTGKSKNICCLRRAYRRVSHDVPHRRAEHSVERKRPRRYGMAHAQAAAEHERVYRHELEYNGQARRRDRHRC